MSIAEVIIQILQAHTPLLAFAAGLFLGDALIFLAILSGAGKIPFGVILVFGLLGDITHDFLFYYFSNSKIAHFIKKKLKLSKKRNIITKFIEKISSKENYFAPLVISKFFYGVRDVTVLYLSHGEKNLKRYFLNVTLAGFIWIMTITGVGWLAGRGFSGLLHLLEGFEKIALILFIALIIIFIGGRLAISVVIRFIKKRFS